MRAPTARPPDSLAVLALGGTDAAPAGRDLGDAAAWYRAVSGGAWAPCPVTLAPLRLDHPLVRYGAGGGVAGHSRALVGAALAALDGAGRAALAAAGGRLLVLVPGGFRAHVWHLPAGGVPLGGGVWCRRYAVVPAAAPLGTVAHELGHLLCGWPDGAAATGARCLMALGGHGGGGADPSPPAAPLALAAGWRRAVPLADGLVAQALAPDAVATRDWCGWPVWAERRGERLLGWTGPADRPRLLADLPLADGAEALGLLAPALRRLRTEAAPGHAPRP